MEVPYALLSCYNHWIEFLSVELSPKIENWPVLSFQAEPVFKKSCL